LVNWLKIFDLGTMNLEVRKQMPSPNGLNL
jgi:hypothetical protein